MLLESTTNPDTLTQYSDAFGGFSQIDDCAKKEEISDLQEQLVQEYWNLIDTVLTKRQRKVVHLSAQGMTQTEIAKLLGVNQSSITKSINGNVDYRNVKNGAGSKRIYGGIKKKIKKEMAKSEKINIIMKQIEEIQNI